MARGGRKQNAKLSHQEPQKYPTLAIRIQQTF